MNLGITDTGFWVGDVHLHHTCSPALCAWIIGYLNADKNKPLYDFGCGIGQYSKRFTEAGFTKVTGYDGIIASTRDFNNIVSQDLTKPFTVSEKGNVVFLEVAEHVPMQYEKDLLDNVANACDGKLIMSWALRDPFQAGHGHVNNKNNDEAIAAMTQRGFIYLSKETQAARATIIEGDLPWFKGTTLIFKKEG